MKNTNKKVPKTGVWLRAVLQVLAYVNQFLILIGQSPLGNNPIYIWISFTVTIIITLLSYWYNNDWSSLAKNVGMIFDMLKDGKITKEELEEFTRKHQEEKHNKEYEVDTDGIERNVD